MRSINQLLNLTAVVILLGASTSVFGQSESATFEVTADVAATCSITAGNTLAFGNYDPVAATAVAGTTSVAVTCSNGMADTNVGLTYTGSMSDGNAGTLTYGLFTENTHTSEWGDTVDVDRQSVPAEGTEQVLTVYGQIDAGQTTAPVGTYNETVTATVYW